MAHALRLGLTGGIGSGKSTVAAMLVEMGAALIDADAIAHSVTAVGGEAVVTIRDVFGAQFITPNGAMDRQLMRELAYQDPSARKRLEAIIHPLVGQKIWQQAALNEAAGHRCLVFDVPLLVESSHWCSKVDLVLVVDCALQTQVRRVKVRSGLSASAVEAIIAAQAPRLHRLNAADVVICNDGISLENLRTQVESLQQRFGLSSGLIFAPEPLP